MVFTNKMCSSQKGSTTVVVKCLRVLSWLLDRAISRALCDQVNKSDGVGHYHGVWDALWSSVRLCSMSTDRQAHAGMQL